VKKQEPAPGAQSSGPPSLASQRPLRLRPLQASADGRLSAALLRRPRAASAFRGLCKPRSPLLANSVWKKDRELHEQGRNVGSLLVIIVTACVLFFIVSDATAANICKYAPPLIQGGYSPSCILAGQVLSPKTLNKATLHQYEVGQS